MGHAGIPQDSCETECLHPEALEIAEGSIYGVGPLPEGEENGGKNIQDRHYQDEPIRGRETLQTGGLLAVEEGKNDGR